MPGNGPSASIARVFGVATPWFYVALLASSLIVLAGMVWPRTTVSRFALGLQIERIGLYPLAGSTLAHAAATLAVAGRTALVSALLIGGISAAALARVRIITVDLHRVATLLILDSARGRRP